MNIEEFIQKYHNHPVLFIGTGISLRYLNNAFTWDNLLKKISVDLSETEETYYDIKSRCETSGKYDFPQVAKLLEKTFNESLVSNRDGKFKHINDIFYEQMKLGQNVSRLKIYISSLLDDISFKDNMKEEIFEFKKTRKNVGSIITTNYDMLIESLFEFQPLVGNDILLSNPYGSVYKIHGCIKHPQKIIITTDDYATFDSKYDLIRAQLLSIFIHNPIIFLGYNIGDENIKSLLKTIFTYVEPNSEQAKKIRDNFLLVEYESNSSSTDITEHDIDLEGFATIRINKIKTDDFTSIYKALSNLTLPISAMDVRKVQNIVKEIYAGGAIKVNITEDLDSLDNRDKIIAIGSSKTIQYQFRTKPEIISSYFDIIDESNNQLLVLINKHTISIGQYFPIYGFSTICDQIEQIEYLKEIQNEKLKQELERTKDCCKTTYTTIYEIFSDQEISNTNKYSALFWSIMNKKINLDLTEAFLRQFADKNITAYRKLLCAYDFIKYSPDDEL